MDLDDRKRKILRAIIKTYLDTGEPVGSRTISKDTDLSLSSATIRNEMSDLEELGYIVQPHTSSGRIPSDKGYRLYVDEMMADKEREVNHMQELMIEKADRMELVLKQIVRVLAANTNYATMISSPQYSRNKLKYIQLSLVNEEQILAVIVLDGNIVKNKILNVHHDLDQTRVFQLNLLLNTHLNGLTIEEINLGIISQMKEQADCHGDVVNRVLDVVAEAIREEEDVEIYTSGATNIFRYPELSVSERASELICTLEEKQQLINLVNETLADGDDRGIQVYIGSETPIQTMKDCSVVTATYELGEGMQGTIGIIGPKRMDYENVVSTLRTLMSQLNAIFKKT